MYRTRVSIGSVRFGFKGGIINQEISRQVPGLDFPVLNESIVELESSRLFVAACSGEYYRYLCRGREFRSLRVRLRHGILVVERPVVRYCTAV